MNSGVKKLIGYNAIKENTGIERSGNSVYIRRDDGEL